MKKNSTLSLKGKFAYRMVGGYYYPYAVTKIRGFKQTHQPSPCINVSGAFSIFATTENLVNVENQQESWYSYKAEVSTRYYYRSFIANYNTIVEITTTNRGE